MEENEGINKKLDKQEIVKNKNNTISKINEYFDNCLLGDTKHIKKASLLSYWFNTYIDYLEQEETFDSSFLKKYSRGDIIKVNLGFNIGNEEGGLHYCVVLDKKNAQSYTTLTVIPLSSFKGKENNTSVFLGDEIYQNLLTKNNNLFAETERQATQLLFEHDDLKKIIANTEEEKIVKNYKMNSIQNKITETQLKIELIKKIHKELQQMKNGSIALINQITTISKQRIYNPKKDFDVLSGIKLSDEKMKLIDQKIKKLYIN